MNKFGVDKEEKGPNKNRLWAKVTKEYNNITGNGHTKARLNKKWQNIKHQRKLKRQKLFDHEADDDPDALVDEDGEFYSRVRPRFFDQVGHETMYASSGNKHFFTKSCHRQTY